MQDAESERGSPGYIVDIYRAMTNKDISIVEVRRTLFGLYRKNKILADSDLNRFSFDFDTHLTTETFQEFDQCSQRMEKQFPSYGFDANSRIVPTALAPVGNFERLKRDLLLTDEKMQSQTLQWGEDGNFRFLDGSGLDGDMVALQSFPRAGSAFLRCHLEVITGVATGSDANIEDSFNLAMRGMLG